MIVKRGDMFYADLSPVVGSEQGGVRPVIIIQNDIGNKHSPTVIAAAITSQTGKNKLPTHIEIGSQNNGLKADSVVLAEQIRTIDKSRLKEKIGHIEDDILMNKINNALGVSFRTLNYKSYIVNYFFLEIQVVVYYKYLKARSFKLIFVEIVVQNFSAPSKGFEIP